MGKIYGNKIHQKSYKIIPLINDIFQNLMFHTEKQKKNEKFRKKSIKNLTIKVIKIFNPLPSALPQILGQNPYLGEGTTCAQTSLIWSKNALNFAEAQF